MKTVIIEERFFKNADEWSYMVSQLISDKTAKEMGFQSSAHLAVMKDEIKFTVDDDQIRVM